MYRLRIPDSVISAYRRIVVVDTERNFRDSKEIIRIILDSFQRAVLPERISGDLNLQVYFGEPDSERLFNVPFYLTVKKDSINRGDLVAMTVKPLKGF